MNTEQPSVMLALMNNQRRIEQADGEDDGAGAERQPERSDDRAPIAELDIGPAQRAPKLVVAQGGCDLTDRSRMHVPSEVRAGSARPAGDCLAAAITMVNGGSQLRHGAAGPVTEIGVGRLIRLFQARSR
jgi:hypothetical protein